MTFTSPGAAHTAVLVERIQSGADYQRSCRDIYQLFRRRVYGFFSSRGFSADECADLTQETFIRVFLGIGRLRDPSRFQRWLFEIASNIYRNELRRRGAGKRDAFEDSIEDLMQPEAVGRADALAALASVLPDPLTDSLRREQLAGLRAELDLLPPQMRRCLYLRLYQGLKYREIAAVMHISIETVKAHLHQAQKRLTTTFAERPDAEETRSAQ